MHTSTIQWYEYTGVAGGSFWILLINILVYKLIIAKKEKQPIKKYVVQIVSSFVVPVVCSNLILSYQKTLNSAETSSPKSTQNVLIVQPNIDPYKKFELSSASSQIAELITATESNIDSNTTLVLWPETAMSVADWQDNITSNPYYQPIFELSKRHPKLSILSGIETYKKYGAAKETPTAKKSSDGSFYYDAFNAAVYINNGTPIAFYNKSKLVPGVESLPTFLNFLGPVLEQFGGSTGGYGKSEEAEIFTNNVCQYISAPIICYESVYGAYVGTYKQKGANLLAIITNDGWWGNTSGHKQHLQYAALRAIETRTWVARSANTGISAVIDPLGNILAQKGWDERAVIKYRIPIKSTLTFYTKYGDWLYQIFSFFAVLLLLQGLYKRFKKNL
jgi:apolipoprotein N-acyltransferase